MSGMPPDYYSILGLAVSATPVEVKRHYRELARRYHPDVNSTPEAAQKIKAINEAHHILSDPERRALYDANRALNQKSAPPPRAETSRAAEAPRTARTAGPSARPSAQDRAGFNGFGRVPVDPPPSSTTAGPRATTATQSAPPRRPAVERRSPEAYLAAVQHIISEAQLAFINRRYREAERLCRQALEIDRRNAVAHEILGDIYIRQGEADRASTAYSYAIQYNPRNYGVQGKLDRLAGRRASPVAGPKFSRPILRSGWKQFTEGPHRDTALTVMTILLTAVFCVILLLYALKPGAPIDNGLPWLTALSANLIVASIGSGVIAGILLAFNGGMRPVSEELVRHKSQSGAARAPVPLLGLLAMFALFWFYLSLAIYLLVVVKGRRVSPSMLRVYGVVLVQIVLFTFLHVQTGASVGNVETAAFAGNILFPATLIGWFLGDKLRLNGR
jgi:curved DNA-binding protein CbpA